MCRRTRLQGVGSSFILDRRKETAALISKPPQGYCILFWRMNTQPPKQRFFYMPLGGHL